MSLQRAVVLAGVYLTVAFILLSHSVTASAQVRKIRGGQWDDASIWSTRRVPKRGAMVVIDHPVTVSGLVRLGSRRSRPGRGVKFQLMVRSGGALEMASGSRIEMNGSVLLDNAPLTMNAGSSFVFDLPVQASGRYSITIGGTHGSKNARLIARGTASAPVSISRRRARKGRNRAVALISDGDTSGGGNITAQFLNIEGLGSASLPAISVSTPEEYEFALSNTRLIGSGGIRGVGQLGNSARFSLDRVSFTASVGEYNLQIQAYNPIDADPVSGGRRELKNCFFDRQVMMSPPNDFVIQNSVFVRGYEVTEGKWKDFRENLVMQDGNALRSAGDVYDSYWLIDNSAQTNPHFLQSSYYSYSEIISGNIFEATGPGGDGDAIIISESKEPVIVTIRNNIVLPNGSGETSGTPFSALGNENVTIIFDHNTFFAGSQSAALGETYAGRRGMVASFRSNIAWDSVSRGYLLADVGGNDTVVDLVSGAAVSNNAIFNILPGSNGFGLNHLEFSTIPTQPSVDLDPQFVDSTRNVVFWAASEGNSASIRGALDLLQQGIGEGADTKSVKSLVTFVRDGFRPQNSLLLGAGHDGKTIGAVP